MMDAPPAIVSSPQSSAQPDLPSDWRGRLAILSAAVLWSSSGFFVKAPVFEGWQGVVLAFWRALFASVLLVPCVRRPTWSWGFIPMVLVFAAMNFTYLTAMKKLTEPSVAIWLQNTAPLWVFVVGVLVWKEPVHSRDWVLIGLTLLGVTLILTNELRGAPLEAVCYGLAAGITYAGVMLSIRRLRHHDSFWLIALNHVGAALVLCPIALTTGADWPHGWQWVLLAAFGMLQMGLPYVLFARGLRTVPSHQAATLALVEPLLLPLWIYLAWGHRPDYRAPSWWTLLGGACILAGLVYRHWGTGLAARRE